MPGFPPTCVCVCQDPPVAPAPPPQELPLPLPVCQDDPVDPVCNEKYQIITKLKMTFVKVSLKKFELRHEISTNVVCATSKASDVQSDQSLC